MATILLRTSAGVIRRTFVYSSARAASGGGPPIDHQWGKCASDTVTMPDTLGHAVGIERWELLAKVAGNEDPFEMNVKKRAKGTVDEPTLIPSLYDKRLVGCICEEDALSINWMGEDESLSINWMHLHKGEPRRCECGYWFKLIDLPH